MDTKREQIADVLLTAAFVGAGFATGNPVITSVVGGIGVNWAADLTQEAWGHACRRLLGESGLLNHDLQQAMVRAFRQAITHLEDAWWKTTRGNHMLQMGEDEPVRAVFKKLREDVETFCTRDHLGRTAGNPQVQQLLYGDALAARTALSQQLASYLRGHDPQEPIARSCGHTQHDRLHSDSVPIRSSTS